MCVCVPLFSCFPNGNFVHLVQFLCASASEERVDKQAEVGDSLVPFTGQISEEAVVAFLRDRLLLREESNGKEEL